MTFMFELYYKGPVDARKESAFTARVANSGGRLTYREEPLAEDSQSICLTFEFDARTDAEAAAEVLRTAGEHVEGPVEYAAE